MLEMTKAETLQGIRLRETELKVKWQYLFESKGSKDPETERYDAFYTSYGLFGDCIESPHKTKLTHVNNYLVAVKKFMKPADLNELRVLFNLLNEDTEIILGDVLGAKKIKEEINE